MNTLIFGDKNTAEILPYTVEFSDRLLVGETITTPVVNIQVFSGTDANPSAMLLGSPTLNAASDSILFTLTGGVAGVVYLIIVSGIISSGNLYIKTGHLAVVASDPFASDAFDPFA